MGKGSLVFESTQFGWAAVALLALAFLVLLPGYLRSPLSGPVKWLAFAMKLLGVGLLALILLDPRWSGQSPKKGANDVVILVDNSRALQVAANGDGEVTVADRFASAVRGDEPGLLSPWLEKLGETFRLQTYEFDERLRRSDSFSDLDFEGNRSGLITALSSLQERYESRPLAAVFVFTDGNATDAERLQDFIDAAAANQDAGGRKTPVYPVMVDVTPRRDASLLDVDVAQTPFEDSPVNITANVGVSGLEKGDRVSVVITDEEGTEMTREPVTLGKDAHTAPVRLKIRPAKPGLSFFNVAVEVAGAKNEPASEVTEANNQRLIAVDRGTGPYRVLYVGGRPNWDYKFLRRALGGDEQVRLTALIRIARREPKFEWRGRVGETSNPLFRGFDNDVVEETQRYDQPVLIRLNTDDAEELRDGFPKSAEEFFGKFRCIIIDDMEAEFFTQEQMELMERFVMTRGGSFLMLGGQESFQQGRYQNTPIGRLLPVYLDRLAAGRPAIDAKLSLTREGYLEPWARLREKQDDEENRLAVMPSFHAVNQVLAIKPGASMVASVADSEGRRHPAIVTQRYGEGRTAVITIGDFWRWGLYGEDAHKDMDKAWRQLMRALIVDVADRIEVGVDLTSSGAAEEAAIRVRVRDEAFRPENDASVKLVIQEPAEKGKESKPSTAELYAEPSLKEPGLFEATYYPRRAGAYTLTAEVTGEDGESLGSQTTGWTLNPDAEEFRSLQPDKALLTSIATATGGKVLQLDEVADFAKSLPSLDVPVTETWSRPLWHSPWVFLAALLLLAGEWALRRSKGIL